MTLNLILNPQFVRVNVVKQALRKSGFLCFVARVSRSLVEAFIENV